MQIFLTGDRSMHPALALAFASQAVGQAAMAASLEGQPLRLSTGDNDGFEAGVRNVLTALGVDAEIVATTRDAEGTPDWDARHTQVDATADSVIFVHTAPLTSSIGASAMRVMPSKIKIAEIAGIE